MKGFTLILHVSSSLNRFKDQPIYIEWPPPSEDQIPIEPQDTPLPQKTIAELNSIDPYEFAV